MTQPFANATNCKFSTTLSDNDPSTIFDLSHVFHTLFVRSSWVDYLENTSADFQNPIPFHFILGASKGKSIVYTSTPFFSSAFTDCFRYSVTNCKLIGAER